MIDHASVAHRLLAIREQLAAAGHRDTTVMAVTKTWPADAVVAAAAAGCDALGENYAQEMAAKFEGLIVGCPRVFIGRLQTNKVRLLRDVVDVVESVDRTALIDELARRLPGLQVMIQVNTDGDPNKGGCSADQVEHLVARAVAVGLVVRGLMTVGPTDGGPAAAASGFRSVRAMVDRLGLPECSMGMSDDYLVAAAEGSTEIRLGSALFGPRPRG